MKDSITTILDATFRGKDADAILRRFAPATRKTGRRALHTGQTALHTKQRSRLRLPITWANPREPSQMLTAFGTRIPAGKECITRQQLAAAAMVLPWRHITPSPSNIYPVSSQRIMCRNTLTTTEMAIERTNAIRASSSTLCRKCTKRRGRQCSFVRQRTMDKCGHN